MHPVVPTIKLGTVLKGGLHKRAWLRTLKESGILFFSSPPMQCP